MTTKLATTIFLLACLAAGCSTPADTKRRPGVMVLRSVATTKSDVTIVVMTRNESLSVKGIPVTMNSLMVHLETTGAKKSDPIFLQAETGTPYPAIVKVVDLLQSAGYTNLALVSNKKPGSAASSTKGPAGGRK